MLGPDRFSLSLRQNRFGQDIFEYSMGSLHSGLALMVLGDTKDMAYFPGTEKPAEVLENISRAIISLYAPWHLLREPQHT